MSAATWRLVGFLIHFVICAAMLFFLGAPPYVAFLGAAGYARLSVIEVDVGLIRDRDE